MRGKLPAKGRNPIPQRITPARAGKTCGFRERRNHICGSPPRVRGKLRLPAESEPHGRITPARAGKTRGRGRGGAQAADHPRACGENLPVDYRIWGRTGSPRACGENARIPLLPCRTGDHPRACGENFCSGSQNYRLFGSPPRVRGKRAARSGERAGVGITPARAGKTRSCRKEHGNTQDHPRACGENLAGEIAELEERGSPPRVRGKTGTGWTDVSVSRDHPRACGENRFENRRPHRVRGSPPRVRGKH